MHSKLLIFISGLFCVLSAETVIAEVVQIDAAVTSDYVWRGLTQTKGKAAVSGGIEKVTDGAWYFGAWASNTQHETYDFGSAELDLYAGMSGQGESLGYDFGYISYQYLAYSGQDFSEMYFALMSGKFTFKYSYSSSVGTYLEMSMKYGLAIKKGATVIIHAGNYSRNKAGSYSDYSASLKYKTFSFTVSKANVDSAQDKNVKVYVGWSRHF